MHPSFHFVPLCVCVQSVQMLKNQHKHLCSQQTARNVLAAASCLTRGGLLRPGAALFRSLERHRHPKCFWKLKWQTSKRGSKRANKNQRKENQEIQGFSIYFPAILLTFCSSWRRPGYLVDWFIFLRHCRRPAMYDEVLARVAVGVP